MSCGLESPNETLNEVKLRAKKCSYAHEAIKSAVKHANVRSPSSKGADHELSDEAKDKIRRALVQTDKAHRELKDFFRQFYTNAELQDLFPEETFKQKYNKLKQEYARIRDNLRRYEAQARTWQKDEAKVRGEREAFLKQRIELEETLAQIQKRCEELEGLGERKNEDGLETGYKRKQQQLEQTLKAQNELIDDLELRLIDCQHEKENFRRLNKILEAELRKRPEEQRRTTEEFPPLPALVENEDQAESGVAASDLEEVQALDPNDLPLEGLGHDRRPLKRFDSLERIDERSESTSGSEASGWSYQKSQEEVSGEKHGGQGCEERAKQSAPDEGGLVKQLEGFKGRPLLPQAKPRPSKGLGLPLGPLDLPPLPANVPLLPLDAPRSPLGLPQPPLDLPPPPPPPLEDYPELLEEDGKGNAAGNVLNGNSLLETAFDEVDAASSKGAPRISSDSSDDEGLKQVQHMRESLEKISKIGRETVILEKEVERFAGTENDSGFVHLKKVIVGNLIKLDDVSVGDHQIIKQRKKEEERNLQSLLDQLRSKCEA